VNFLDPKHFHDTKFWLKRVLITAATALAIGFAGYFIITSKMSTWLKLPVFIVFLVPAIIAAAIVAFYPITASAIKFATEGRDPIKAGTAIVTDLLEKGVHPDDIISYGKFFGRWDCCRDFKKV
jgi:hypothetical protein